MSPVDVRFPVPPLTDRRWRSRATGTYYTPPDDPPPPQPPITGWPDATNTGPTGTLTPSAGMTISTNGATVENLDITGVVTITGTNVTLRNCRVSTATALYPINITGTGATVENVRVDNLGGTALEIFIQGNGATIRACEITNGEDGIRIQASNVLIEDNYIHDLQRQPGGHHDTCQIRSGDNVTIRHNTLLPYKASTNDSMNSALQIGSLTGSDTISNLLVDGNYVDGGNYTFNGGGRGEVDSAIYRNNVFGRHYRYGPYTNIQNSVWETTNVYADTGEPV